MIEKVVAYIVRGRDVLVFTHADFPEAGMQVPAGTVEAGEPPEQAVMREVREETGRADFRLERKLAVYEYGVPGIPAARRHVFQLSAPDDAPARWRWGEHYGTPQQITFDFFWVPLDAPPELAGGLGGHLAVISLPDPPHVPG